MNGTVRAPLLRRIATEHARVLIPLAVVLVANGVLYGVIVNPMARRVANIEERNRVAEAGLANARLEYGQANGALTGKAKAAEELATFYSTVLPKGLPGARRLTSLRLDQMAEQADLDLDRRVSQPIPPPTGSTLTQLRIQLDLIGAYTNLREFLYELETAPEFVVIDNLTLAEGGDDGATLTLTMQLSTYFRTPVP